MPIIQTDACKCSLCGYVWIPGAWRSVADAPLPTYCAGCKSARWNGANGAQAKESTVKPIVEPKVEPIVEQLIVGREVEPIEHQTPAKEQPKIRAPKAKNPPWKEVKAPAGKKKLCPHGFLVLAGGITMCPRCK